MRDRLSAKSNTGSALPWSRVFAPMIPTLSRGERARAGARARPRDLSPLPGERVAEVRGRVRGNFRRLPAGSEGPRAPLRGSKHHQRRRANQHAGRKAMEYSRSERNKSALLHLLRRQLFA